MKRTSLMLLVCCFWILNVSCGSGNLFQPDKKNALRAPSYPLITIDLTPASGRLRTGWMRM